MFFRGAKWIKSRFVELRDLENLYNLEEESEITKNEITNLNNWREVAYMDEKVELSKMQEIKEKEKKYLNTRVRELKKEIEKNDLEELIIGRSKSTDEVKGQIDFPAKEFQKLEEGNEENELANEKKKK